MITAVTVLAFVTVAHALVRRFEAGPFERATYVVLLGAAMWLASVWALAVVHLLTRPMLLARTAVVLIAAVICVIRTPFRFALPADRRAWAVIAPLALWIAFVLVRAAIVPPVSHDALAYHLPKAVLYSRAQGFEIFPFLNAQIRGIPANYEMLLADSLTLDRGDAFSEWIGTFFYVAFVIGSAAIAERWWRRSVLTMALAAASIPVVLLHAGAHKNDLMTAAFTVGGLVGAGRFFATRDVAPLLIAIVSFGAGTGTKPQAAMVALATAPFILWRLRSARTLALVAVCSLVAFLLLGGMVYIENVVHRNAPGDTTELAMGTSIPYGDWSNFWQVPYVLAAAPFSRNQFALSVPWETAPWFWRRYELYFSHLGIPFAIAFVLFPVGVILWVRRATPEALAMTVAATAAMMAMLPTQGYPHGMFAISLPRYMLYFVPVIFAWTIVPPARGAVTIIAILLAFFVYYAIDFTANDRFEPWSYVVWAAKHPGTRVVPFDPNRAACVVDRAAGPRDTIAIDAAFGSWLYPAFGAQLERNVEFIQNGVIPPDAQWVIVDRGFQAVWSHPDFHDLSQARQFLTRGKPAPGDLQVVQELANDARFIRVYYDPKANQAVFRRVRP